jgi:hypothetical protein
MMKIELIRNILEPHSVWRVVGKDVNAASDGGHTSRPVITGLTRLRKGYALARIEIS